jgi:hypothetical protein
MPMPRISLREFARVSSEPYLVGNAMLVAPLCDKSLCRR